MSESYEVKHVQKGTARAGERGKVGEAPSRSSQGKKTVHGVSVPGDSGAFDPMASHATFVSHLKDFLEKAGL